MVELPEKPGIGASPGAARVARTRGGNVPAAIGLLAVVACLIFDAYVFEPIADPRLLHPWLVLMALVPLGFAIGSIVAAIRPPTDAEHRAIWVPVSEMFRAILYIGVMISPWVLLPNAGQSLRALMLMLYIWFMAVDVLTNFDPPGRAWIACTGVPASLGIFLISSGADFALPLTGFLALTGASLFALREYLHKGRGVIPTPAPSALPAEAPPPPPLPRDGLTPRQIEVLRLIAQGQSNKDIARTLGVSPATVKTHVAQIIAITGTANRTGASMHARSIGLV